MKVYQIGVLSFESERTDRELKGIGGIQGYINELVHFLLSKDIQVGFVGKIYNYKEVDNLEYFKIQNNVTSTNKLLIHLFFKSFFIKLPKDAVFHAHRPDHFAAFAFAKSGPSVLSLHGQAARIINDRKGFVVRTIYNFLEKMAMKKADVIMPVDDITRDYYIKLYPQYKEKYRVIPTGVNTSIFKKLDKQVIREKFGFSKSDKIVLYVGRIAPPKKIKEIIKAFEILVNKDNSYKLLLVGNGVDYDKMKTLTSQLKLSENINFFGVRKRSELPVIFNMADVCVLYSKNEGSPLSIKESLACGVPVVANCVGDIPLVIKEGYNGFLVENESNEELASKLELAIDKSTLMSQNCLDSVQKFTTEKINQQVIELYQEVIKKNQN